MNRDDIIRMAREADAYADWVFNHDNSHPDWHGVRDAGFAALVAVAVHEKYSPIGTVAGGGGERTFMHPSVKYILPIGLQLYARIQVRKEDKV